VKRPADRSIRINSADYRIWESSEGGAIPAVEEPLVLPKAAVDWFADRGLRERGVDLFLASEVAPGTGLGSSSAMTVALVRALAAYLGFSLSPAETAELASWIEIERLDKPIGKQDHYAGAFGGLNAIEFAADGVTVQPLSLSSATLNALSARLMLFSTGQTRDSAKILREQRDDTRTKRSVTESLHRIKALALQMREALEDEDLDRFGQLLDLSWCQKKQLSGKISSAAIDRWYAAAQTSELEPARVVALGAGS
jgi:D-glycero-alpha-D-manno-heptose-7-phosphate kinase